MGGDSRQDSHIVHFVNIGLNEINLARAVKDVRGSPVERDANRLELHRGLRALDRAIQNGFRGPGHLLVVVPRGNQADELDLASRRTKFGDVCFHPKIKTRLPGVDSRLLTIQQDLDDPFIREPLQHVLVIQMIEMRVAVHGIAAHNQPRDAVWAQAYGRQQVCGFRIERTRNHQACSHGGGALQEIPATAFHVR